MPAIIKDMTTLATKEVNSMRLVAAAAAPIASPGSELIIVATYLAIQAVYRTALSGRSLLKGRERK